MDGVGVPASEMTTDESGSQRVPAWITRWGCSGTAVEARCEGVRRPSGWKRGAGDAVGAEVAWLGKLVKAFLGVALLAVLIALSAVLGLYIYNQVTEEDFLPKAREILDLDEPVTPQPLNREKVFPGIVQVRVSWGLLCLNSARGTGFIIDEYGRIGTAKHVAEKAGDICGMSATLYDMSL